MLKKVGLTILFFLTSALVGAGQREDRVGKDPATAGAAGRVESRTGAQPAGLDRSIKQPAGGMTRVGYSGAALAALAEEGDSCDCTIFPYKPDPPCTKQCTRRSVLGTASKDELLLVVGVESDVAERIVEWKAGGRPDSLRPYTRVLNPEQINNLAEKLQGLTGAQIRYFQLPAEKRQVKLQELKAILNAEILRQAYANP